MWFETGRQCKVGTGSRLTPYSAEIAAHGVSSGLPSPTTLVADAHLGVGLLLVESPPLLHTF